MQISLSEEQDLNINHLIAQLGRIDVLIWQAILRWQRAGQDSKDNFRGLYLSDADAIQLVRRLPVSSWGQVSELTQDDLATVAQAGCQVEVRIRQTAKDLHAHGCLPRLESLQNAFTLSDVEIAILLICLAPMLDLRYEQLYGYLQDDVTRKRPSVNLLLNLLCDTAAQRLSMLAEFQDEAPLLRHGLLEFATEGGADFKGILTYSLLCDSTIPAYLLGRYQPGKALKGLVEFSFPVVEEENSGINGLGSDLPGHFIEKTVWAFIGSDPLVMDQAARQAAALSGCPLLRVDLEEAKKLEKLPQQAVKYALRDALLTGAIPYFKGWECCLENGAPPARLLGEILYFPKPLILASQVSWQVRQVERSRRLAWKKFSPPSYEQRQKIWQRYLGETTLEASQLAGQFKLTESQIRDAVASAHDLAAQDGRPLQVQDLFNAARAYSNPNLINLARKISPRYGWKDIILPQDQLEQLAEIIATVRGRSLVLEEWGVGHKLTSSQGVTILFAGPPGTGKTMAAEIIAGELGIDLYKIDLSTVVSKYIGETEKNLERIFQEADSSNAILFFDEADAIFGKRSEVKDAHDRYANLEISYLLQRMEAYDGVTILATNLRANLDEAFTRRLQFAIDFPFPEEADRLRIWQSLFPPEVPHSPELNFERLARRFKLAGGNIRNVIVTAAYMAAANGGTVTMEHLLHGTRRELQKMGRLVEF